MSPSICRRLGEALKCGEALLRVWLRPQLHAAGILVGGLADPVADRTLPQSICGDTTDCVPGRVFPVSFNGTCSIVTESREMLRWWPPKLVVMMEACNAHICASSSLRTSKVYVVHGVSAAVLRWAAALLNDQLPWSCRKVSFRSSLSMRMMTEYHWVDRPRPRDVANLMFGSDP
jgi:hypothetical protein